MRSLPCSPVAAAVLLVVAMAAQANADCSPSTVTCQGAVSTTTASSASLGCANGLGDPMTVAFDVPGRTIRLTGLDHPNSDLVLRDVFTVHGPAAGSPVTIRLRLRYHGVAGGFGPCCAVGSGAVGAQATSPLPCDVSPSVAYGAPSGYSGEFAFSDSVDAVFLRTAETPVALEIHVSQLNGYSAETDVGFGFIGLPAGASVTSCKGYAQDQPVPAVVRSWGNVKASYR